MKKYNYILVLFSLFFVYACNQPAQQEKVAQEQEASAKAKTPTQKVNNNTDNSLAKFGMDVAEEGAPEGLEVGTPAPDFTATDQHGKRFNLQESLTKGATVVIFYRGRWCPVCNQYFTAIKDSVKYIQEKGASFVAIGPETPENASKMAEKNAVDFPILSDAGLKIMDNYKVTYSVTEAYNDKIQSKLGVSIAENNGSSDAKLPVPATYIIDKSGEIKYVQFNPNYTIRASVKEILENL